MSCTITREERRLIDQAIADGKVKTIARGVSGYALDVNTGQYVYDHDTGRLVSSDPDAAKRRMSASMAPRSAKASKRREIVRKYHGLGLGPTEIYNKLNGNIPIGTISSDLRVMGLASQRSKDVKV